MDGGSSLNVIFSDTLRKILIPRSALKRSDTTLYSVEPGKATSSLGRINLDVIFGNRNNFRRETLEFEVVNWQSQ